MIIEHPRPKPLFLKYPKDKDIFIDGEATLKRYRERVETAINGKKVEGPLASEVSWFGIPNRFPYLFISILFLPD